jgi:hypothetical protein
MVVEGGAAVWSRANRERWIAAGEAAAR